MKNKKLKHKVEAEIDNQKIELKLTISRHYKLHDLVCGKFNYKVCSKLYLEQVATYRERTYSENYDFYKHMKI
jgi:hypothetical protein